MYYTSVHGSIVCGCQIVGSALLDESCLSQTRPLWDIREQMSYFLATVNFQPLENKWQHLICNQNGGHLFHKHVLSSLLICSWVVDTNFKGNPAWNDQGKPSKINLNNLLSPPCWYCPYMVTNCTCLIFWCLCLYQLIHSGWAGRFSSVCFGSPNIALIPGVFSIEACVGLHEMHVLDTLFEKLFWDELNNCFWLKHKSESAW